MSEKYFRNIPYEELMQILHSYEKKYPELFKIEIIGKSGEGRDIPAVILTDLSVPDGKKNAMLLQANVHSVEKTGTSVLLYLYETILKNARDHRALLSRTVLYCIPCVNPDGAELVRLTGINNRSKCIPLQRKNAFIPKDIDNNELICQMRWKDPGGNYQVDTDDSRLMRAIGIDSVPEDERYSLVEYEGEIAGWDGTTIDSSRNNFLLADFNRNFPANWEHFTESSHGISVSSGTYPLCFPETKAVADFILQHPQISIVVDMHNGTYAMMYPPSVKDESAYPADDMQLLRTIAQEGEKITKLPAMSDRDYRAPNHPRLRLPGHFPDWVYETLGLICLTPELGNVYMAAGLSTKETFRLIGEDPHGLDLALIKGKDNCGYEYFKPWKPFMHPQIGEVEIGGRCVSVQGLIGDKNFPWICSGMMGYILRLCNFLPSLHITASAVSLGTDPDGKPLTLINADFGNSGLVSTGLTRQYETKFACDRPVIELHGPDTDAFVQGKPSFESPHIDTGKTISHSWIIKGGGRCRVVFRSMKTGICESREIII